MAVDLEFEHVSKRYWLTREPAGGLLARVGHRFARQREAFWAVRDVSLAVGTGESIAIIGRNGAGKSTLLKLISAITAPTEGEIRINGRLAALIEVGSGFHPELTGRDNVFLSGAILGMRRAEIASKFDRIVEFAGVGTFIDAPVKFYSSGMYVRLGFAVAAHVDAQILLVDEVLAVGDEMFQQRCYRRIQDLRAAGTTIVFISHDLATVERLCQRAVFMKGGRVAADGPAPAVVAAYRQTANGDVPDDTAGVAAARTTGIEFVTSGEMAATGYPLRTIVRFSAAEDLPDAIVEVSYSSHGGAVILCEQTTATGGRALALRRGAGAIEFNTDELGLQPGSYDVTCRILRRGGELVHAYQHPTRLIVDAGRAMRGYFYMPHRWRLRGDEVLAAAGPLRGKFGGGRSGGARPPGQ